jgi:hypothetical protein
MGCTPKPSRVDDTRRDGGKTEPRIGGNTDTECCAFPAWARPLSRGKPNTLASLLRSQGFVELLLKSCTVTKASGCALEESQERELSSYSA